MRCAICGSKVPSTMVTAQDLRADPDRHYYCSMTCFRVAREREVAYHSPNSPGECEGPHTHGPRARKRPVAAATR